jgi:hypothetical protein
MLMPRARCLAMTVLLLAPGSVLAGAGPDLGANAALKYWRAFATLPTLSRAEQSKLNAACLSMPLDAKARELLTRADYALQLMHRGAALPRCEWGIDWEEGVPVQLPQAIAARVMCSLACLRARLRFEQGRKREALDDIFAALTMARHVGRDTINITLLSGQAVEHRLIEALALHLPQLDAATIKGLKKRLDALPPAGTPAAALKVEEKFALDWFVRTVKEAPDEKSLRALIGQFFGEPGDSRERRREKTRAVLEKCGGTANAVLRLAEQTRQSYVRLAMQLDLPPDQFADAYEREVKKQSDNTVFKLLFPAVNKVRLLQARADLRRALLAAALAVQLDGKGALKKHRDPVVGGPFEYVAFKGGFELRSRWKVDEKWRAKWKLDKRITDPVTLTVGRREK